MDCHDRQSGAHDIIIDIHPQLRTHTLPPTDINMQSAHHQISDEPVAFSIYSEKHTLPPADMRTCSRASPVDEPVAFHALDYPPVY